MGPTYKTTHIYEKAIDEICSRKEQYVKNPADFTRNRKLGFKTMLKFVIAMHGQTIDKELFDYRIDVTSSAFIQARQKLSDDVFETIFHNFKIPVQKKLDGYRLLAFDGSDIRIPYNEGSETFVRDKNQFRRSSQTGYNSFHLNALYDILNKQYVDAIVDNNSNERKSARTIIDRYSDDKAIVMCDRGYMGYNVMEHFNRNPNLDYVIRVRHGDTTMKCLRGLPMEEFDIDREVTVSTATYPVCKAHGHIKVYPPSPYGKKTKIVTWEFEPTCTIRFRVVRVLLNTGEYETLITTLPRNKWSKDDIKELYHLRWGIETSFRELRYYIGVIHFHSKDESFIKQEIYANLIAYNFCAAIAMTVKIRNYNSEKYYYKIDFSFAFHVIKDYLRDFSKSPPSEIDSAISKKIEPVRKDRKDERKMKPKGVTPFMYRVA